MARVVGGGGTDGPASGGGVRGSGPGVACVDALELPRAEAWRP